MNLFWKVFTGSSDKLAAQPLKICPECGSQAARETVVAGEGAVWRCPNPDCPAQVRGRLEHWCSRGAMELRLEIGNVVFLLR